MPDGRKGQVARDSHRYGSTMKRLLLLLVSFLQLQAQETWEQTWGTNYNSVYHLLEHNNVFYMTSENGCYRSTDKVTWSKLKLQPPYSANYQFHYLAASGRRVFLSGRGGLLHSDDDGLTWSADTLGAVGFAYAVGSEVYIAGYPNLYYSPDGGNRWELLPNPFTDKGSVDGIVCFRNNLYVSALGKIYRYYPAATSWSVISEQPARIYPSWSYAGNTLYNDNDQVLYCSNGAGLSRTTGDTVPWTDISAPFAQNVFGCKVIGKEIYILGEYRSFRSDKNNIQWDHLASLSECSDLVIHNGEIILGSEDGLYRRKKSGGTWQKVLRGIDPGNTWMRKSGNRLWADGLLSTDNGYNWQTIADDSLMVLIDDGPDAFAFRWRYFSYTPPYNLWYFSTDSFMTWKRLPFDAPARFNAHNNMLFVVSGDTLYRSHDKGQSWQPLHFFSYVSWVNAGAYIFIIRDDGSIQRSSDEGSTWTDCTKGVDTVTYAGPYNPQLHYNGRQIYYTVSKFYGLGKNSCYYSNDLGSTWQRVPENGLTIDTRTSWAFSEDKLYVTGFQYLSYYVQQHRGVFEMKMGDSTWTVLQNDSTAATASILAKDNYLFRMGGGVQRLKVSPDRDAMEELKGGVDRQEAHIFPNPASGRLQVRTSFEIERLALYTTMGRVIKVADGAELDVSAIPAGLYYVRGLGAGDRHVSGKVVVKH
jgi:photosystem II stability/assembly factor-like uncharacterized protein